MAPLPRTLAALSAILVVTSACPAPTEDLQVRPEVPAWSEGPAPKTFRALVVDKQHRALRAVVEWERPALSGHPLATGSGAASSTGSDVYAFTLGAEHRPDTLLRTQTVRYRWRVSTSPDAGSPELLFESAWLSFQVACADHGDCWLMAEQDRFVDAFDNLSPDELGMRGYVPSHGPRPFKGLGITFFKEPTLYGEPPLLFYEPRPSTLKMRLAGWGYASTFDIALWPRKGCIPFEAWFVHEQGWHLPDGGFIPVPPGTVIVPPPGGVWHPRLWDVHLWRREGSAPLVAIEDPGLMPDEGSAPDGAFVRVPWTLPE